MSQKLLRTLASFALITSIGCDDPDDQTVVPYTARTVEDGLFFAPGEDGDDQHALLLDVSGEDPKTTRFELPGGTVSSFTRPGKNGEEVVLLTSGLEAVRSGKDKRAALASSVLVFGKGGQLVRKDLQGRYKNLSLSPDGRYAIAFGSQAGLSVDNSAEVIDFDSAAPPVFVDLSLDARAPTNFVFSAPGAFSHKVAVAPQPNALQIIDLDNAEAGPISITLTTSSSLNPTQILFSEDRMFVRSAGSNQILVLQAINVPNKHGWQPAPQQLFARSQVQDIAVIGKGAAQRLLAVTGALEVFDPAVGPTAVVEGVSGFDRILQFEGSSPIDGVSKPRAMLYSQSRGSSQVGFVDLGDETAWSTRNVELVELGDAVTGMKVLTDPKFKLAIAQHSTARAGVIDLQARTVRRLVLNEYAGTLLLDEKGQEPQLWARGEGGELGRVNLSTFARVELPFSFGSSYAPETSRANAGAEPSSGLLYVPSKVRPRVAVLQPAATGRVTFVDANAPNNDVAGDSALEVLGIYLSDLLD